MWLTSRLLKVSRGLNWLSGLCKQWQGTGWLRGREENDAAGCQTFAPSDFAGSAERNGLTWLLTLGVFEQEAPIRSR